MKVRYWMTVYPYQFNSNAKPFVSESPLTVTGDAKLMTFEVEIPDDLFGAIEAPLTKAEPAPLGRGEAVEEKG